MEAGSLVRVGALELKFLVDETQGSGDLVLFECAIPAGARVPAPHSHEAVDEAVYGLSGVTTTTIDGELHELRAGDFVLIPRGRVHQHENRHCETARALMMLTPGRIGRSYFEEIGAAVNGPGAPDPATIAAIMRRHGLVPA